MTPRGTGSFDDAAARAFLEVLLPEQGALGVFGALHAAAVPVDLHVSLEEGVNAVAAAEVVAMAFGNPPPGLDALGPALLETVQAVLPQVREMPNVRPLALQVLTRVVQENSETADLWRSDLEAGAKWMVAIGDLTQRLEAGL